MSCVAIPRIYELFYKTSNKIDYYFISFGKFWNKDLHFLLMYKASFAEILPEGQNGLASEKYN
jgi:hypothetical protein